MPRSSLIKNGTKLPPKRAEWGAAEARGAGGFSMRLEFPRTASVKDYLRTVDFESTEVKVHWTDERGQWVRRIFSRRGPTTSWSNGSRPPKGRR